MGKRKQVKETGRIRKGERTNRCHCEEGTQESGKIFLKRSDLVRS